MTNKCNNPIKSFSIRYCQEFTEDIFNKFIQWLKIDKEKYPKLLWRNYKSDDFSFKAFSSNDAKWYVYFSDENSTFYAGIDNNKQGQPEISVNELCKIINYNEETTKVPEYVECIIGNGVSSFSHVGKIYKVESYVNNKLKLEGISTEINKINFKNPIAGNITDFKPSTKEAFEAQNKPKFEVGKWYKVSTSTYNWHAKFKQLKNNAFYFSDIIDIKSKRYSNEQEGELGLYFYLSCNFELLTDLSEIQQYLPEGHVDKIKKNNSILGIELIHGETYHIKDTSEWIIKVKCLDGENLKTFGCLSSNSCFYNDEVWGQISYINDIQLASQDQKDHLEACIKANKFVPKDQIGFKPYIVGCDPIEKTWIPKVGDYLYNLNEHCQSAKKGSIAQIIKTPYSDSFFKLDKGVVIKWVRIVPEGANQSDGAYYFKDFRKALPHEIPVETSNNKTMSKEELLAEAKRRYPLGTKFRCVNGNTSSEIVNNYKQHSNNTGNVFSNNSWLYLNGKWAEIISLPEQIKQGGGLYEQINQTTYSTYKKSKFSDFETLSHLPAFLKKPSKDNLEFQDPVIMKRKKNKNFKLVTINQ